MALFESAQLTHVFILKLLGHGGCYYSIREDDVLRKILPCVFLITITSCATVSVWPVRNEHQLSKVVRGVEYITIDDYTMACSIAGRADNQHAVFTLSIANKSDSAIYFDENNLAIDIGNYETNKWKDGQSFTASQFFKAAQQRARTSEILMAVALGLSSFSAGRSTSRFSGTYSGYTSSGSNSGSFSGSISTYDPAAAQYQMAQAQANMTSMMANNKNYLDALEKTLLFSSQIEPLKIYTGLVFVPLQND
jgi:hypothetical protein